MSLLWRYRWTIIYVAMVGASALTLSLVQSFRS